MTGQHPEFLKQWVLNPPSPSVEIRLPQQDADEPAVGRGFEVELGKFWFNQETEKWVRWHERYLVLYSQSLATSQIRGLQQRLEQAQTALDKLASKPGDELEQLNQKVEAILKRHRGERVLFRNDYRRNPHRNPSDWTGTPYSQIS